MAHKRKFRTADILSFYFVKPMDHEEQDSFEQIRAFLMRDKVVETTKLQLPLPIDAMRKPLIRQVPWLNGLTTSYRKPSVKKVDSDFSKASMLTSDEKRQKKAWLANLIKNHGQYVELEPFTKEEIKQIKKQ